MFNFSNLTLDKRKDPKNLSSFVGIIKNSNGNFDFRLPIGFDDFPENSYQDIKKLFFSMYKTFRKFEKQHKGRYLDELPKNKDNAIKSCGAYSFIDKNDEEVLLYSKISTIDSILSAYDNLAINTIIRAEGKTDNVNFDKIDKYLDQAIYIDDVIYIDEYESNKNTLNYSGHSIVDIYSFILYEIKKELEEEVSVEISNYYKKFKMLHLNYDDSIFNEKTFENTISILKDSLDKIDKVTAYKDSDYWNLYSAVEIFLYGDFNSDKLDDNGIFWGINNFYQVWEDMCNSFSFKHFKNEICYSDTNITVDGQRIANSKIGSTRLYCRKDFDPVFYFSMRGERRYARPDLIKENVQKDVVDIEILKERKYMGVRTVDFKITNRYRNKKLYQVLSKKLSNIAKNPTGPITPSYKKNGILSNCPFSEYESFLSFKKRITNNGLLIIDWKYVDFLDYSKKPNCKIKNDIIKQLFYEISFYKNESNLKISSIFAVPFFYKDERKDFSEAVEHNKLDKSFRKNKIEIFKINFDLVQRAYIENA